MENYITSQRDHMFRNVEVMIYVFDVESRDLEKDLHYYQSCIDSIIANSKDAKVFCLIHKMDLIPEGMRDEIFKTRVAELRRRSLPVSLACFQTSIWDETLYKAWSSIVYSLIPNVKSLESHLENFCRICDADEIVLFERTTFLVICHATSHGSNSSSISNNNSSSVVDWQASAAVALTSPGSGLTSSSTTPAAPIDGISSRSNSSSSLLDSHRFEKISNIIKNFKLSCSRSQSQFQSMEVRGRGFAAFVDVLTPNMFAMVVNTDATIQSAAIRLNIASARKHFERIEQGQFAR